MDGLTIHHTSVCYLDYYDSFSLCDIRITEYLEYTGSMFYKIKSQY